MEQQVDIKDYAMVIKRHLGVIILFFVTVVCLVTIGSFLMKPVYRATAILLIDVESPDVLTTSGMVSLDSRNYYTYKEYYQSQIEIIRSRLLTKKVFEEFRLGEDEKYAKAKDPIKSFLKTIKIDPIRDTRLISLNIDNQNPVLAAAIANRMAELYVRRNLYYISRNEMMNLLKNEYLKMEAKLSEYSKVYKDKHPAMIRLHEEINEVVKKIEAVKNSMFDFEVIENDFASSGKYPLEGLKPNNVSIQDPAEVPLLPVKPRKRLNIMLAAILGLFGGIGIAFFFEYLDENIKTVDELEKSMDWTLLGVVPEIGKVKKGFRKFDKGLLAHVTPKGPSVEAFKHIRTKIFNILEERGSPKSIVVSSPGPEEGKTTNLCNLGIVLAKSGKKVLLVDSDLRRPRLQEFFNKKSIFKKKDIKGLSDFLVAHVPFDGLVQKTDIDNLYLVSCGLSPSNPSELLSGARIKEFISAAENSFDIVLFDSSPIAVVTDAVMLSKLAGQLIIVIQGGKTSRKVLHRMEKTLKDSKINVMGAILNKVSVKNGESAGYYYHSHYYNS